MLKNNACVIGYPIHHSLSPRIHSFWLNAYNIEGNYSREEVRPDDLTMFLNTMVEKGFKGCNVTIPHKEKVKDFLEEHHWIDSAARKIGAVNTIKVVGEQLQGFNTDFYGFMASLKAGLAEGLEGEKKCDDLYGKKVMVIGAGGAARGIIYGLFNDLVDKVILTNRTQEKADKLAADFGQKIEVVPWEKKTDYLSDVDVLVNTTSLGMIGQPPLEMDLDGLLETAVVTDIIFNPLHTELLMDARKNGHKIIDGLGMLLHQAAPAFKHFYDPENEAFHGLPEVTDALRNYVLEGLR